MNMLPAMVLAWVGVCVLSGGAAVVIVLGDVQAGRQEALRNAERQRMCLPVPDWRPVSHASAAGAPDVSLSS